MASPTRSLRIITFNIHHGATDDETPNLPAIADLLDSLDADVIGLQEVDRYFAKRSGFEDQVAWLAGRLGMHSDFAANIRLDPLEPGLPMREYGIALLSRLPLLDCMHAYLPEPRVTERRGVLAASVDVDGTRVRLLNTHLTTNPGRIRRQQFRAVRDIARREPGPAIIMGDLNAPSFHLRDYWTLTNGLRDTWAHGRGILARHLLGATNPVSPVPLRRIDYILTRGNVETARTRRIHTRTSDHLPVMAELRIR